MNDRDRRNLNPHAEARLAMFLWSHEYAHEQRGGCMDFWDSISEGRKRYCAEAVTAVIQARDANGRAPSPPTPTASRRDREMDALSSGRDWPKLNWRWWRFQRLMDAWSVLFGGWSLHRAWQAGHDNGTLCEYRRIVTNKAYPAEVKAAMKRDSNAPPS